MNEDKKIEYFADYELIYTQKDLDNLDFELSEQQNADFKELLKLQNEAESEKRSNIIKDLLEASKEGVMNFVNSFTDTMDTFDHLKNPNSVNDLDSAKIERKRNQETEDIGSVKPRALRDAQKSPYDGSSRTSTTGMSKEGVSRLRKFELAYQQRTKSLTNLSTDGHKTSRSDPKVNAETLSGLRSYRFGPIADPIGGDDFQRLYDKEVSTDPSIADRTSRWIRGKNYDQIDEKLVEVFGFKSKNEAKKWRMENHLTPHETAEGVYLIPEDVHGNVSHTGYCSQIRQRLKGEISKTKFDELVRNEKVQLVAHEAKVRTTRAANGMAMSMVRDFAKTSIVIFFKETYEEFKESKDEKLVVRIKQLLHRIWEKIKGKCKNFIQNIWATIKDGLKGSLVSEFFTLLNDFIFKTFKNAFRVMRMMWNSIVKAFKIIFSGTSTWQERIFEAAKILSAGVIGVIGFSLNELVEKGLTSIGIPFSSFFAEIISGLLSAVLSAVVLMIFDNFKRRFFEKSPYYKQALIRTRINNTSCRELTSRR